MHTLLKISNLYIDISSDIDFPWTKDVSIFKVDAIDLSLCPNVLHCDIKIQKDFPPIYGTLLYTSPLLDIMSVNGFEHCIHYLPTVREPFALTVHNDSTHVTVYLDARAQNALKWDRTLIGLFSLEHYYLPLNAFLLHSSYIIHEGEAVIFTAPSGTGKSTQADLWKTYAGADIINGDRTLLSYENGRWHANGFPVCGSSDICHNKTAPIKAIVCLNKAPENHIVKRTKLQLFHLLYSQSIHNSWNAEDTTMLTNHLSSILSSVSVYDYYCTKEADAVSFLKNVIEQTKNK